MRRTTTPTAITVPMTNTITTMIMRVPPVPGTAIPGLIPARAGFSRRVFVIPCSWRRLWNAWRSRPFSSR
jgi:hypothetical protein